MDKTSITIFITVPIGAFLSAFLMARQDRIFKRVFPQISSIFIRNLLVSIVMGVIVGGLFTFLLSKEPMISLPFTFLALFVTASVFYYLGTSVGLRHSP
jgi:uncharacterized protein YacL